MSPYHRNALFALIAALLLRFHVVALAVEPPRQERLRLPAQLDAASLQKHLDTIDQPGIASALKLGYFGGRASTQGLPVAEGFALLKATLEKEPVASKRWFYLQNVRGWAAFRCKDISPDEGFAAYGELFDQAGKAKAAGTVYAPQSALDDWVAAVKGKLGYLRGEDGARLRDDERTAGVLLKAWTAYASLLTQTNGRWNGREPDWKGAIDRAGATEEFTAAVEKTLTDTTVPKTFYLLSGAISVMRNDKPDRALELFTQAKPLLPKDKAEKIIARVAEDFFDSWVALLNEQKKTIQAIIVARERLATLGSGHAKLLKLQLESKDEAGAAATLGVLGQSDAPEAEVVGAAQVLNNLWEKDRRNEKLASQSQALLQGFLEAARQRSAPVEIEARYRLGWLLIEHKKTYEARAALDISRLRFDEASFDSSTQFFLKTIRALQAQIATQP